MNIVRIENTVRDFDTWKQNFDKFEAFRAEQGVQSYRVTRAVEDHNTVRIDLLFADVATAQAFLPKLTKVLASPQAREQLVTHAAPQLFELVTDQAPAPTA